MRPNQRMGRIVANAVLNVGILLSAAEMLCAQSPNNTAAPPVAAGQGVPASEPAPPENGLANQQSVVAERFKKLEALLLKSAELESADNPTRAAILQQAAQLGKQSQVADLLARAAKSLEQKQFSQAIEDQKSSRDSLKRLLELLQSENRQDRIREQKEEVRRWIEDTDRLLRLQISQRGRTEGGQEAQQASKDQGKLAEKAQDILQGMKGNESPDSQSSPPKTPNDSSRGEENNRPNDKPPSDPKDQSTPPKVPSKENEPSAESESNQKSDSNPEGPDDKQSKDSGKKDQQDREDPKQGKPSDETGKKNGSDQPSPEEQSAPSQPPSDGKQSESSQPQPSDSRPQPSSPKSPQPAPSDSSQPPSSPQDDQKDPQQRAKQRIQSAQQKMKDAQQKLEKADREGAVDKQLEAEEQLRAAIEELEEILRQMREEEIERSLAAVDTRLRRMLEMQSKVLDETKRLQSIAGDKADRQIEIRASNLSLEERKILSEGERVQLLLREEGSSVAFPEAINQMLSDIQAVVDRLAKGDVGKMTVAFEQEIVSALEEMIAALAEVQKEQKERQQQQQNQPSQQPPPSGEQPLIDKLAELRLIRTLQVRVNKRTNILSEMLQDPNDPTGQAEANDILLQIRELAQRQSSVQRVTRDIVIGKDK